MSKKKNNSRKNRARQELSAQRVKVNSLLKENSALTEKVNLSRAEKEDNADIFEEYLRYRKMFMRLAEVFLRQATGISNWARSRTIEAKAMMDEKTFSEFSTKFNELEFIATEQLKMFEEVLPKKNAPYDFHEHDIDEAVDDSGNLFVKEVVSPGYKFEGVTIKKAKVTVSKRKGRKK